MSGWKRALLFGALTGAGALLLFVRIPLLSVSIGEYLEERVGLEWLFAVRGPIEPPANVVVVGIDERSATQLGLPSLPREWPRSLHGKLTDELVRRGASLIVFDLTFERAQSVDEDRAFADAVARAGRVVLFERVLRIRKPQPEGGGRAERLLWIESVRRPLPMFAEAALATAPFPLPQVPSRVREFWAFWEDAGRTPTLPSVALQARALESYGAWTELLERAGIIVIGNSLLTVGDPPRVTNLKELTLGFRSALTQDPRLGIGLRRAFAEQERRTAFSAAESRHGPPLGALVNLHLGPSSYYLNFYGPPGTVRTIPYHALAADPRPGRNDDLDLAGASVFVGYSEFAFPSKVDGFDTVFTRSDGVQLSGVEIAATAFANLLTGRCLRPADTLTKSLILLAFGCAVGACAFLLPPSRAMPAAIGLAASYVVGAQLFFGRADVWLPLAVPVFVQLPALLFTGLLYQRKNIWRAIRIFVPDKVAKQTAEHPHDPIAVKQTAFATCLASDAEDYTALSERMAPAEAAAFLNDYFEALAVPLRRHEADFREFHADSMLSAWIANTPDVSVRKRACLAALDAIDAIDAFNARKAPLHLGIRLGLHAGEIFLGNVGAGGRFAFRLVGDIVNTASRIESLNKALGTRLLATEAVVAKVDGLLLRPLGQFQLKGRRTATPVVEILSTQEPASAAQITLCAQFARALHAYQQAGHWRDAAGHFRAILEEFPEDGAARFYLQQCLSRAASSATEDDATIIRIDTKAIAPLGTKLGRQT